LKRSTSFYVGDSVDALIATLDAHVPKDVQVTAGLAQHIFFQHRSKLQMDYYWVVNDTDRKRVNEVHFAAKKIPEKWNALTGEQEPLFYTNSTTGTGTCVSTWTHGTPSTWSSVLSLGPSQDAMLEATNAESLDNLSRQSGSFKVHMSGPVTSRETFVELRSDTKLYRGDASGGGLRPLTLDGDWQFKPLPDRISVPYAKLSDESELNGTERGWASPNFDDTDWPDMWLNEEQTTINWADRIPVDLHKSWNEVLVKVGKGRGNASGFYGFTFRVADDKGATLPEVEASTNAWSELTQANDTVRWYRIELPPGCVAVVSPTLHGAYRILLNGHEPVRAPQLICAKVSTVKELARHHRLQRRSVDLSHSVRHWRHSVFTEALHANRARQLFRDSHLHQDLQSA
jgi:hypothetical protein